jgi:predicted transglutaminase-like cysteine proteinase
VRLLRVALPALLAAGAIAASAQLGFSRSVAPGLITQLEHRFGKGARERLEGWKAFVRDVPQASKPGAKAPAAGENGMLRPVNRFFNLLPEVTDLAHWGVEDYWATPAEALASNGADCEDYAIAKYFALKELGVPIARLRMVYVRATRSGSAHMVLAYYRNPSDDPLILDNLEGDIRPASARPDLIPVYSFNDEDLVLEGEGAPRVRVSATTNRKWRELMGKLERELAS